jgi:tRNA (guanine-N7-)-methyltransferase
VATDKLDDGLTHPERVRQRREALRATFAKIFARQSQFVWEVGCGHGHFLTAYAQAHPDQLCLGVDMASDRIARAARKRERSRLAHLHFIQAESADFLASLPAAAKFSAVYILFPDPWPKRRHHKNRLMTSEFLRQISERAGEGTRLYFRTDYAPYYSEARQTLQATAAWRLVEEAWPFESPTVFQARAPAYQSFVAIKAEEKAR